MLADSEHLDNEDADNVQSESKDSEKRISVKAILEGSRDDSEEDLESAEFRDVVATDSIEDSARSLRRFFGVLAAMVIAAGGLL